MLLPCNPAGSRFNMSGLQQFLASTYTRYDPSPRASAPMGRKRRAASGDTVAHVGHTGHLPSGGVDHGLAMRMVLQAMVAGTKTNAAMPQRSEGDGRQSESWVRRMGEMVEHQNTLSTRRMGGSSPKSSRDTVGHGRQSRHPNTEEKHLLTNRGGKRRRKQTEAEFEEHRKRLVGLSITVGKENSMVSKLNEPGSAGGDGSCSESNSPVKSQSSESREVSHKRGSLKKVLNQKLGVNEWKVKSRTFCEKFLALNTALSRNSKRRQMVTVLKQVKGEPLFLVNQEELTVAASVLDEAKLVSADQYLHEIKLIQVEMGGPWNVSMERQLVLCKKSDGSEDRGVSTEVVGIEDYQTEGSKDAVFVVCLGDRVDAQSSRSGWH